MNTQNLALKCQQCYSQQPKTRNNPLSSGGFSEWRKVLDIAIQTEHRSTAEVTEAPILATTCINKPPCWVRRGRKSELTPSRSVCTKGPEKANLYTQEVGSSCLRLRVGTRMNCKENLLRWWERSKNILNNSVCFLTRSSIVHWWWVKFRVRKLYFKKEI